MKRKKLLSSLQHLDDKYIEEADPMKEKSSKRAWTRLGAIAACFAVLLGSLSLWMFIPYNTDPPDVGKYASSEYYSIIKKLNEVTYQKSQYKNRFERLMHAFVAMDYDAAPEGSGGAGAEIMDGATGTAKYEETTDNQVAGVIESDLIKRSDRHIFYMGEGELRVYDINGTDSALVGSYEIPLPKDAKYLNPVTASFYLSNDCTTVTYFSSYTSNDDCAMILIVSLDVTDPANIKQKNTMTISGSLLSSRLVDGKLLVISTFYVGKNPDFSNEREFLPQIDCGNGAESIPLNQIISPDKLTSPRYTVVTKIDQSTLSLDGCTAFLSYSSEVYVSLDSVYVTRSYQDKTTADDIITQTSMTEISRLRYAGGSFEHIGSVTIAGSVKDQYSLDEYEGVLRVVTTTSVSKYKEITRGFNTSMEPVDSQQSTLGTNASLYCIDLATLQVIATKESFAPAGESVQSVRFDGNAAYVCTSLVLSDPVFFFDLSDLSNITYTDTGTIEGFSSSLVNLGNGFLLGIGVGGTWDTVKIEIYEENDGAVVSVCKYEFENASYYSDYKSYFINREQGLVGLGVLYHSTDRHNACRYNLLHFDGYRLHSLVNTELDGMPYTYRAVLIDGYFYMFAENDFEVVQISQQ